MGKVERNYGQISYQTGDEKLKVLRHYDKALEILKKALPAESLLIKKYTDERRQIFKEIKHWQESLRFSPEKQLRAPRCFVYN